MKKSFNKSAKLSVLVIAISSLLLSACATQQGQVAAGGAIGALVGAGVGNLIGKNTKSTVIGAAIGAGLGAGTGYAFGGKIHEMIAGLPPESGVTAVSTQPNNPNSPVKISMPESITFDSNSSILKASQDTQYTLDTIVRAIQAQPYGTVIVVGHADSSGNTVKNQQLALDRAINVTNTLNSKGIDARKVRAEGRGDKEPVADNATPQGRAKNRRVEITVYPATTV
jgi:outer membrane protein OmpA-like peptidoglycan-associated protein